MSKLERLTSIVLAALVGVVASVLAMLVLAKDLGMGGNAAIPALVLFVVVGGISYRYSTKLVAKFAWLRWPVLASVVAGAAYLSINYQGLGFEDPVVPAILVVLPIALLYFFLPNAAKPAPATPATTARSAVGQPVGQPSPATGTCKAFQGGRCVVQGADSGPCDWDPSDWQHCNVVIENRKYGQW